MSHVWCSPKRYGVTFASWSTWTPCWPRPISAAVLFVLSTNVPAGRRPEWVQAWEEQYGWPVGHRGDNGDLIGEEAPFFFDAIEPFNRFAQQTQIVLVNQFGWSQERCGSRMPADMEFLDIRRGSDLEFGQSIYEPFGIAQVEPLTFGALSCVSNVCGCNGFVASAAGEAGAPHLVVADYVTLPTGYWLNSPYDALGIDRGVRDWIEGANSYGAAQTIFERLPKDGAEMSALLERGQEIAREMSWDVVARDMFLPGLHRAMPQPCTHNLERSTPVWTYLVINDRPSSRPSAWTDRSACWRQRPSWSAAVRRARP